MPEFWTEGSSEDDFALPGDEERLAAAQTPEPEAEAETPEEAPEETETTEPRRDEKGRFAKAEPEVETPEEVEPTVEERERLYAGRYKSVEEMERALEEKERFIGSQGAKLGELQALVEQVYQNQQQPQVSDWDDLIDRDPAYAAEAAWRSGDQRRLAEIRERWDEVAPGAYVGWAQSVAARQELAQLRQQMQAQHAPIQERQEQEDVAHAYGEMQRRYEDFDQHVEAIKQYVANNPDVRDVAVSVLEKGTVESKVQLLDLLYGRVAGPRVDTLRDAARVVAREQAEETERAKKDAIVASATATVEAPKPTPQERLAKEWQEMDRHINDGWNV